MAEKDENKFDLGIRSILENGREEVPDHIWDAIESRLPAPAKKTVLIPVWAKAAAGFAAAAAIAAAVVFTGVQEPQDKPDNGISSPATIMMADASEALSAAPTESLYPSSATQAMAAEAPSLPENDNVLPTGNDNVLPTGNDNAETAGNDSPESAGNDSPESAGNDSPESGGQDNSNTGGQETEDAETLKEKDAAEAAAQWAALLNEEERQPGRVRTSLTISGNASTSAGNGSTERSVPMQRRHGRYEIKKNTISESSESRYGIPASFAVGAKVIFTPRWSLGIGVNYSLLTRKFAGNFIQPDTPEGKTETYFSNIRNRQDYIGIPLNVYFSILKSNVIDFYAYAGGAAEKCVSNRFRMEDDGTDMLHKEKVKGMQFSVNLGIGLEFIIADQFGIYIDPSARYYFRNAYQPRSIRTAQPFMLGVEIGFRVRL